MKETPVLSRKERNRLKKFIAHALKPTKTERRRFNLETAKQYMQKFAAWFLQPNDIVKMSDRQYRVMPNGEWRRTANA